MGERNIHLGLPGKGAAPRSRFVRDHAQGVEVAQRRRFLTHGLLGRQILGGAHHHARSRQLHLAVRARNPEVRQLYHAVLTHQDVGGLNVAVNHTGLSGRPQSHGDLHENRHQILRSNYRIPAEIIRQGTTLDQLHDDPPAPVLLTGIQDVRDIRVLHAHRIARLQAQARQGQLLTRQLGTQHLGGDSAAADAIARLPDFTHSALRNVREQRVASPQEVAGHRGTGRRCGRISHFSPASRRARAMGPASLPP